MLPREIILKILSYSDHFRISCAGEIIQVIPKHDFRYALLSEKPMIRHFIVGDDDVYYPCNRAVVVLKQTQFTRHTLQVLQPFSTNDVYISFNIYYNKSTHSWYSDTADTGQRIKWYTM
jgi:hypothetical protein